MKVYKNKLITVLILGFLLTSFTLARIDSKTRGIVDDKETAMKVAKVLLHSVYGNNINNSLPLTAESINNDEVWYVRGTLNYDKGGVPYIQIRKSDCKVLKFGHTK